MRTVYRIDQERCKTCWHCEGGSPCVVPLFKEYELFRSEQKIAAQDSSATREQMQKMLMPPCSAACPANICIQGYVALIASGRYKEALRLIRDRIPFPSICGGVCPHPCEDFCIRGEYDEPIAINALKRFVAEREMEAEREEYIKELSAKIAKKGKKVAVIGAGPAGLTCAHDLVLRGYEVTVFEALPIPGGMMAAGIPAYRLPREILNKEIELIQALGVEIITGVRVGQDVSLKELFTRGYEAIFIAAGAHVGTKLGIPGENSAGVLDALSFLRAINLDKNNIKVGKRVAVIGGGDAAIDAARTALRLGAENVFILYRRSREEMPAHKEQVEAAEEEGVKINFLAAPIRFIANKVGGLKAIECLKMALGEPDETGRRRPVPIAGSKFKVLADTAIVAIGQTSDLSFITAEYPVELTEGGRIKVDQKTCETSVPKIFAGGDIVTGPKTVIHAIAAGRRAAYGIDLRLSPKVLPLRFYTQALAEKYKPNAVIMKKRARITMLPVEERIRDFSLIEQGFTKEEALAEAYRCLACGLCTNCNNCIDNFACPALYLENGKVMINEELCNGCGVCADLCPNDAIVEVSLP